MRYHIQRDVVSVGDVVLLEGKPDAQDFGVGGQHVPGRVELQEVRLLIFGILMQSTDESTKSVSLNQIPSLRFSLFSVEADSSLSYLDSFLCPTVCICKVSTRWQLRSVLGFLTSLSSVSSCSPIFTKLASNSFLLS